MPRFNQLQSIVASNQFGLNEQTDVFAVAKNGALTVSRVVGASEWSGPLEISQIQSLLYRINSEQQGYVEFIKAD